MILGDHREEMDPGDRKSSMRGKKRHAAFIRRRLSRKINVSLSLTLNSS